MFIPLANLISTLIKLAKNLCQCFISRTFCIISAIRLHFFPVYTYMLSEKIFNFVIFLFNLVRHSNYKNNYNKCALFYLSYNVRT